MNKKIFKAEDLPEGEEVYLRKGYDGWRVIYPFRNKDGSLNWKNIILGGNWGVTARGLIFLLFLLSFFYVYDHDTKLCRDTLTHLNDTCIAYKTIFVMPNYSISPINLSEIGGLTDVNATKKE